MKKIGKSKVQEGVSELIMLSSVVLHLHVVSPIKVMNLDTSKRFQLSCKSLPLSRISISQF